MPPAKEPRLRSLEIKHFGDCAMYFYPGQKPPPHFRVLSKEAGSNDVHGGNFNIEKAVVTEGHVPPNCVSQIVGYMKNKQDDLTGLFYHISRQPRWAA